MNYFITGPISLTAISPSAITFCPPEPLVIEVDAGGEYAGILWTRTPVALNLINNQLVDFDQTFLMTTPSVYDAGLYQVIISCTYNQGIYLSTLTYTSVQQVSAALYVLVCLWQEAGRSLSLSAFL